jgi:hypothetical protein
MDGIEDLFPILLDAPTKTSSVDAMLPRKCRIVLRADGTRPTRSVIMETALADPPLVSLGTQRGLKPFPH